MADVDAALAALSASAPAKASLDIDLWLANRFIRHPATGQRRSAARLERIGTSPVRFDCDSASIRNKFRDGVTKGPRLQIQPTAAFDSSTSVSSEQTTHEAAGIPA